MTLDANGFVSDSEARRFYQWFAEKNDFDLADRLHGLIEDEYGYESLMANEASAHLVERSLHLAWGIGGFIDNGGMANLYTLLDFRPDDFAEALKELGLTRPAQVVFKAIDLLVDQYYSGKHPGKIHLDWYDIRERVAMPDVFSSQVDDLSRDYFAACGGLAEFSRQVGTYVRGKALVFLPLLRSAGQI
ncbi:MAG: hypothetical protein AAGJ38_10075 [Planctomycetota bacterium]